ncbi:glycoside hydrolase domain-containing protein, partial [Parabacteroides distasonis]
DPRYYPGKTFTIRTANNAPENVYIQSAKRNGKALNDFRIPHATLVQGGLLERELGPKPNKTWGVAHQRK